MLKRDFNNFIAELKTLDKKVVTIFLSVVILQTVSWYYTSRSFFRNNLFDYFVEYSDVYLIEFIYWFIGDFFALAVLPILIIKFLLKEKIHNYGITFGDYKRGLLYSVPIIILMGVVLWFVSAQPAFANYYPQYQGAKYNWNTFFIYEVGVLIYMAGWEFIWRGYTLFGLKDKFGYYAIFIQMIPFVILHNGKPPLETFSSILGGLGLGVLTYMTRSVFYCIIIHFFVMFIIDFFSIMRFHLNDYGTGIRSFINILSNIF